MDTCHSWRDSLIIEKIVDSALSSSLRIDTRSRNTHNQKPKSHTPTNPSTRTMCNLTPKHLRTTFLPKQPAPSQFPFPFPYSFQNLPPLLPPTPQKPPLPSPQSQPSNKSFQLRQLLLHGRQLTPPSARRTEPVSKRPLPNLRSLPKPEEREGETGIG